MLTSVVVGAVGFAVVFIAHIHEPIPGLIPLGQGEVGEDRVWAEATGFSLRMVATLCNFFSLFRFSERLTSLWGY